MDTNILLESGTNELEILEFVVDGHNYWNQCGKDPRDHQLYRINANPECTSFCGREHLVRAERQLLLSIWRSVWE